MSGKAKKYDGETIRIQKSFTRPLNLIEETLYSDYTREDLLYVFKKYYPLQVSGYFTALLQWQCLY